MELVLDPTAITRLIRIGGVKLARQMVGLFLEHGPDRVAAAEAGAVVGDCRMVEAATHSLKSSAGNVGAARLQQASAALELAAQEGRTADLAGASAALRTEYDAAEASLTTRLSELVP